MIIAILVLLGLCFGSFVNALVWRIHEQTLPKKKRKASDKDLSIAKGRSMCTDCGHTLHVIDLVPILSWVSTRGRCRYCKKPVSWQYPLVELITAILFVVSYLEWPYELSGWAVVGFGAWLACLTGFMALIVYDIRWMLLPNRIIFPMYGLAALFVLSRALQEMAIAPIMAAVYGILIGGGIFYVLFQASNGKWIGGGDVKLGFLLGALVGGPLQASLLLFTASLLGTFLAVPLMALGLANRNSRIPFGPFLIAAAVIVQLYGVTFSDWYIEHFISL